MVSHHIAISKKLTHQHQQANGIGNALNFSAVSYISQHVDVFARLLIQVAFASAGCKGTFTGGLRFTIDLDKEVVF